MITDKDFWIRVFQLTFQNIKRLARAEFKVLGLSIILYGLAFYLLDYAYFWLIGVGIAVFSLLPVLGAGMIFVPWIIYEAFFHSPSQALWLFLVYIGVELVKQVAETWFLGKDLAIPWWMPVIMMIASSLLFNVFGVIISSLLIPFIAAFKEVQRNY
ncbi:AI-2E family transporter [Hutsoniella sourekii]|uniref:AI-2E family transporter n=1 Tax=Hutsoniella sourekii TaxID=87650 RepID=UPI0004B1BB3F|nr:AI-2E family transporter [Hutsoniella sourekii]